MSGRLAALGLALLVFVAPAKPAGATLPPIHHVYVIVLENESASTTFGPHSPAPYLAQTLRARGAYLPNYYGIGHASNDNYIAMISGQAPNVQTQSDCQLFGDFIGAGVGAFGQQTGVGCVYPAGIPTVAGQFDAAGLVWRDYNESMGADPARETAVCGHPAVGGQDKTQSASATDQYATRHNPFVYFHSIIDDTELCNTHVSNLDALSQDLQQKDSPNYSFITPSLCNDGHDASCANGRPGGLPAADAFLRRWVPRITGSPAFQHDSGLLVITFDEAATSDTRACCGEIPGPGSPEPGINGPGGGQVGAVVISPYIAPGTVSTTAYNHYSLLRSVEDLYRLPHIGYAQLPGERPLGADVFACAPTTAPIASSGRLPAGSEVRRVRVHRNGRRESLEVYSVGNATLRATVRGGRRTVSLRRTLIPCHAYTFSLPAGRGHTVSVAVAAGGGAERVTLRY